MVEDTKTDWMAIKDIANGKVSKDMWKEKLGFFKTKEFWKMMWIVMLCLICAFILGWVVSAKYYEVVCHNMIIEITEKANNYIALHTTDLRNFTYGFQ